MLDADGVRLTHVEPTGVRQSNDRLTVSRKRKKQRGGVVKIFFDLTKKNTKF